MGKKSISIFLIFIIILSCCFSTIICAKNFQTITIDGYEFYIIENNIDVLRLQYNDKSENVMYNFKLNKFTTPNEAAIDISINSTNLETRSTSLENFKLIFNEQTEYASGDQMEGLSLLDVNSNEIYDINVNQRYALPIGIPFLKAAIDALLTAGAAIIVANIAYIQAEEAIYEIQRQNEYKYYNGILRNNAVFLGNGLITREAKVLAYTNDEKGTVFALTFSLARGLVSNVYDGPEIHGASSGYWNHIHARSGSTRYLSHIWFAS